MHIIGRLFAAAIGFIVAVIVAALFLLAAEVGLQPQSARDADWFYAMFTVSSIVTATGIGAFVTVPASIVILVTEFFALRSWVIYAAAGGAMGFAASKGVVLVSGQESTTGFDATVLMATGFVAGLAYWLVAGRMAGFFPSPREENPDRQG